MADGYWLGIDLGTSGVKTLMMDTRGAVVDVAHEELDVQRPHPGWSEQSPATWWFATLTSLQELASRNPKKMAQVQGIGLSGQMHGATLLDVDDDVLRPAILWNDGRSEAECAALDAKADFRGIGGNPVMPGFTAPKLEWVRKHEPEIFEKVSKVLLPKDYIRLCLTGEYVSDMSDSAGTLWLDVEKRAWSPDLLAATGLAEAQMPLLVEGSQPGGRLRPELARRWGMQTPPVVAGGGGDNAASAAGVGAVAPGTGFLSLGTSGVLFVATDGFRPNTEQAVHAFCHAVPDVWHQMGVILSATDTLNWLARITSQTPADLAKMVDPNVPLAEPITFLPYLSGERTPHNDAGARGGFFGVSHATELPDLAFSALAGVAYAFADSLAALTAAGASVDHVHAIGGGAQSRAWLQMIADATGLTLHLPTDGDFGAAFGAARLGFCASEGADPIEVLSPAPIADSVTPNPDMKTYHEDAVARYRAVYPGTRSAIE